MIDKSKVYISRSGSLYIKFKDLQPGDSVFRLIPTQLVENDMLEPDWFGNEIAEGKTWEIVDIEEVLKQKS
jgi:hypothetical protein